jgi:hypothetical protein
MRMKSDDKGERYAPTVPKIQLHYSIVQNLTSLNINSIYIVIYLIQLRLGFCDHPIQTLDLNQQLVIEILY